MHIILTRNIYSEIINSKNSIYFNSPTKKLFLKH